jgi:uncharacterized protein (TIGR03067 family)
MKLPFLLLAAGLMLAADKPRSDSFTKDQEKLQGTWELVSVEFNGQGISVKDLKDARLMVKGKQYNFKLHKMALEFTFCMDPAKKPKAIDLKVASGPDKGKVYHGIYVLEGNTYRICRRSEPDKSRPTAFVTKKASGLMMVVWKRHKP